LGDLFEVFLRCIGKFLHDDVVQWLSFLKTFLRIFCLTHFPNHRNGE
jgi:hypothetical protein